MIEQKNNKKNCRFVQKKKEE